MAQNYYDIQNYMLKVGITLLYLSIYWMHNFCYLKAQVLWDTWSYSLCKYVIM